MTFILPASRCKFRDVKWCKFQAVAPSWHLSCQSLLLFISPASPLGAVRDSTLMSLQTPSRRFEVYTCHKLFGKVLPCVNTPVVVYLLKHSWFKRPQFYIHFIWWKWRSIYIIPKTFNFICKLKIYILKNKSSMQWKKGVLT